jgi:LysM repeat protein
MKKITENQLKDRINSLREYLKVYENQQVDEWSVFNPSTWGNGQGYEGLTGGNSRDAQRTQDAAKNSTAGGNMALVQNRESLAPGSVASEQGKDGVTYAVDAKGMRTHKIESNKWVAMNPPTPTEQPELMAAPADQAASVTPAAPTGTQVQTDDNGNHMITTPDGKTMVVGPDGKPLENGGREAPAPGPTAVKIARFKELLAKAAAPAAAAAQSPYSLAGQGAKLKANESTTYFLNKLRLIESRQLNEALTPEEQKEMDSLYAELGNTEVPEPGVAELINQYNTLKKPAQAAQVTPAAPAKTTGPVTWKQIYDANKDVIGANPNLIKPGQQLKMPDGSTYTVKPGDNLSKIAKNASGGQGASVAFQPKPPVAAPLTTAQQGFKDYGMAGQEMRSPAEIAASAGLADAPATPDAGLTPSDPRHSGHAAWKAQQDAAAATASQSAADAPGASIAFQPGANARDDLLARRAKPVQSVAFQPAQKKVAESVGYNELQRIVSLVNHR